MDENIADRQDLVDDPVLDRVGDRVAVADGPVGVDLDVDVSQVFQPDLADPERLDTENPAHPFGEVGDPRDERGVGLPVHQVLHIRPEEVAADPEDRAGDEESGPLIGPGPDGTTPAGQGDTQDHGQPAERVEPVIPGRRHQRRRPRLGRDPPRVAKKALLQQAPAESDSQGESRRGESGDIEREKRFARDPEGEQDQQQGHANPGHRLEPGVAVGVFAIGGALRDEEGTDQRRGDRGVDQGMRRVGDKRERMAEDPAQELDQSQDQADGDPPSGRLPRLAIEDLALLGPRGDDRVRHDGRLRTSGGSFAGVGDQAPAGLFDPDRPGGRGGGVFACSPQRSTWAVR